MTEQNTFEGIKNQYIEMKDNGASWEEMDAFLDSFPDFPKRSLIQRLSRSGVYKAKPKSSGRPLGRPPIKPSLVERICELSPELESDRLDKMTVKQLQNILELLEHTDA